MSSSNEFVSSIVSSHNVYVCRYVYMPYCTLFYSITIISFVK